MSSKVDLFLLVDTAQQFGKLGIFVYLIWLRKRKDY